MSIRTMSRLRGGWINLLGFLAGCALLAVGIIGLMGGISFHHSVLAVLGFLVAGWAALDYRRFLRGTPESEIDGGRTIE
jgi:hypothetical protein